MQDLVPLIDGLGCPRIAVVGDLILDRYTWGNADRVSPEAHVPVLWADEQEVRPGGAASVAALLQALGAEVVLAGIVGDDGDGRVLARLLEEAGVETAGVLRDANRPTTAKERFMGRAAGRHAQQILRVDRESRLPLTPGLSRSLVEALAARSQGCQALLIADYGKGVCTPAFLASLWAAASKPGLPVLVDPARLADYGRYRGATIVKPNRAEAELVVGRPVYSPQDALAAGQEVCRRFDIGAALVTLDRDGMVLARATGEGDWFPTQPREVYDITGAGDMVLAVTGLCRAAGLPLEAAARLANVAAGLEVERSGVAPVSRSELRAALCAERSEASKLVSLETMTALAAAYRRAGRSVVFANGCFDLLHAGHLTYLREAATLGDVLVVAVNSDDSVRRLKGPSRPAIAAPDRAALVAALEWVDHVLIFDEDTPHRLLALLRPDVLVKGGTYTPEEVVGREVVEAYGGRVCVTGRREGISTTRIITTLQARSAPAAP
jgi:D-beta-D-heptose 7-phosphate kinase/D-beta-D-heptose 1-phosphate adenosyltransferase